MEGLRGAGRPAAEVDGSITVSRSIRVPIGSSAAASPVYPPFRHILSIYRSSDNEEETGCVTVRVCVCVCVCVL